VNHLSATRPPLTAVPGHPGATATTHPAGTARRGRLRLVPCVRDRETATDVATTPGGTTSPDPTGAAVTGGVDEDGSLVAEYGLLAVVAATVAGVLITWARGGALAGFFDALLSSARGLVGA
jgi:Flp pilus assembly pilin Flp